MEGQTELASLYHQGLPKLAYSLCKNFPMIFGKVIEKDLKEAFRLYKLAADQG